MPSIPNPQNTPPQGVTTKDVTSLVIRVMAGLTMILYNSWLMVQEGWDHLWNKGDWTLLTVVSDLGAPMPVVFACAVASAYFFGSIFLILGVFGRVPSIALLVLTEVGCYFALRAGEMPYVELSILYGTLYFLHILVGSGRISLDQLLAGFGRKRFRRRNPAEF